MKFGIAVRNMGPQSTPRTIRECARIAESAGFEALVVSDHLCIPPGQTEGSGGRYLDVLATLAYLAGITSRIKLGVSVLVLPYRPAVLTGKQVATIQELSDERMILGVGVGWMKEEFEALGVDSRQRGALASETLEVLHHLWAEGEPRPYRGGHVNFPAFVFLPRPKRPPIWVGGNGAQAIERVLRYGDGWHPLLRATDLKPAAAELRRRAREAGRPEPDIIVRRRLKLDDPAAARATVEAYRDAGATWLIVDLGRYADAAAFGAAVDTFMTKAAV